MVATVQEPEADTFLSTWAKISQVEPKKNEENTCNLESYRIHLRGMVLREEHVAKVVKGRIYSVAAHPSESRTLVAAGDKWGQVGLWDLIFRNENHSLSSFDFLASDASTLVVGMWDGRVAIVDRRTPRHSPEFSADLHAKTRTVHVHPVDRHYFITAGERNVAIYDARHLKNRSQPVLALTGHTKSVASAYFSPVTGNRVVTTCADDTLRPNNNTGRWLTRFQAVWDPKRDDCFVVGSMTRPRQIQAFHASREPVHSFSSEDHLNSVCSSSSWHPTRYIVVGGSSSGRLHVFKE